MRLIDADAFEKFIRKNCTDSLVDLWCELVRRQPTIEAVPVVHGEWIRNENPIEISCECSICHAKDYWYDIDKANEYYWFHRKFCPNCGARMNGGTQNSSRNRIIDEFATKSHRTLGRAELRSMAKGYLGYCGRDERRCGMRDYTRKAKRVDNGEWIEGFYFCMEHTDKRHSHHFIIPLGADLSKGIPINSIQVEVDPDTICEPTGLTDNNGYLIWENDVVRYYDDLADMNKEVLVKWNETHASFTRLYKSKMGLQYLYINECIANRCEVIGNIFDDPELLKGGDE